LQFLASQGILLTNFYAVTHPSEPNYCAVVAGDHFGMDNDDFLAI
jgi:acid phosphatase